MWVGNEKCEEREPSILVISRTNDWAREQMMLYQSCFPSSRRGSGRVKGRCEAGLRSALSVLRTSESGPWHRPNSARPHLKSMF